MWTLELMDNRFRLLRQHMKFKLSSDTKELIRNLSETLDNVKRKPATRKHVNVGDQGRTIHDTKTVDMNWKPTKKKVEIT